MCVTVKGPPFSICFLKSGITEPLDPSTFPKRVMVNFVFDVALLKQVMYISAMRLEAPITLVGFTALSVDTITKRPIPYFTERSEMILVPKTFILMAS